MIIISIYPTFIFRILIRWLIPWQFYKKTISNIKENFITNLPPVSIAVRIIPQDHISTGSPRYGVFAHTYK
jgi:hypothetical protein